MRTIRDRTKRSSQNGTREKRRRDGDQGCYRRSDAPTEMEASVLSRVTCEGARLIMEGGSPEAATEIDNPRDNSPIRFQKLILLERLRPFPDACNSILVRARDPASSVKIASDNANHRLHRRLPSDQITRDSESALEGSPAARIASDNSPYHS
jgi:hypothetical protein